MATTKEQSCWRQKNSKPYNCANNISINACLEAPILFIAWVLYDTLLLVMIYSNIKWLHDDLEENLLKWQDCYIPVFDSNLTVIGSTQY